MNTKEVELIIDGKSNKSTSGKIWTITKFLTSCGWNTGKFVVKNTPTALGAAWEIKKEVTETIVDVHNEYIKEQKELAMEEKIKMLSKPIKDIR
ncbi:hypothetical protein [Poseidonibacter antarcticus]|uniref:hypothetical protein n=1 Tax=Poseidonibacter antarcticus TaxID=2478538 RepID=UPI000EF491C9|nr:hypothetical protein [Poseidonibacter antarcticus]